MSDARERPQYGEYASVDEQIAAGGFAVEPDPVSPPAHLPTNVPAERFAPSLATTRVVGESPASRPWDLALTTALLVVGAYSIVTSIPELLNFGATLKELYAAAGYGEYTSISLANGIGVGIVVTQAVIYIATVLLTIARLRKRRIAFFVPVAGAVASGLVIFVLVLVAMTSDPALAAWVGSQN